MCNFFKKITFSFAMIALSINFAYGVESMPGSHPDNFPKGRGQVNNKSSLDQYNSKVKSWLESTPEGKDFLASKFSGGLPATPQTFRTQDVEKEYAFWYHKKFAVSQASQEKIKEIETQNQQAIQKIQQEKELTIQKFEQEKELIQKQMEFTQTLIASGSDKFTNSQVNNVVEQMRSGQDINISNLIINDTDNSIGINAQIDGKPVTAHFQFQDQNEYNRLKIILSMFQNLYSKHYNQASGSFGDLISDILSSAKPQPFHYEQTSHLTLITSKLNEYLKYHEATSKFLENNKTLPLNDFLKISFLSSQTINNLKIKTLAKFDNIAKKINFKINVLDKFIEKARASIIVPTEVSFSNQEIQEILRELGLLLKSEYDCIFIASPYYSKLSEINQLFEGIFKEFEKNQSDYIKSNKTKWDNIKQLLQVEIMKENIAGIESIRKELDTFIPKDKKSIQIDIPLQNALPKLLDAINKIPNDDFSMPYQDSAIFTNAYKNKDKDTVEGVKAVIFLIKQFAPKTFLAFNKFLILGELDTIVKAACSRYYGVPLLEIQKELNNMVDFDFSLNDYQALKNSEKTMFVSQYVKSLIERNPIIVDIDKLKESILSISMSAKAKTKRALALRTCELFNSTDTINKKDLSLDTMINIGNNSAYLNSNYLKETMIDFEIQKNSIKNNDEQIKFLDSYLRTTKGNIDEKNNNLLNFFNQSLAAKAEDSSLVKLILSLPQIKTNYKLTYEALTMALKDLSRSKLLEKIKEFYDKNNIRNKLQKDQQLLVDKIFYKLQKIEKISEEFLITKDNTQSISTTSNKDFGKVYGFKVDAGLTDLDFDRVFSEKFYFTAFYNAVKILHFFDLTSPSEADLNILLNTLSSLQNQEAVQLVAMVKNVSKKSVEFFEQIKTLMTFVQNFKIEKDKYHVETGTETIDFYKNIDQLDQNSPSSLGGPPSLVNMTNQPPSLGSIMSPSSLGNLPSIGSFTMNNIIGYSSQPNNAAIIESKLVNQKDQAIHNTLAGGKFNPKNTNNSITLLPLQQVIAIPKINSYYKPFLNLQLQYFKNVDCSKLKEEDALPIITQLILCIDLYLRMYTFDTIMVDPNVKNPKGLDDYKNDFIGNYLEIFKEYTIEKMYKAYKNPQLISNEEITQSIKFLRSLNPIFKEKINNIILQIIEKLDFSQSDVDIITPILKEINDYLALHPFINNNTIQLSEIKSVVSMPPYIKKAGERILKEATWWTQK